MAFFSKNIDMLNGTIWDKMVVFAIPLALTGVLQQLYNLADVAVLGLLYLTKPLLPSVLMFRLSVLLSPSVSVYPSAQTLWLLGIWACANMMTRPRQSTRLLPRL